MIPIHDDNPSRRTPYLTYAILATCALVFAWQFFGTSRDPQAVILSLGFIPAVVLGDAQLAPELQWVPGWTTVFTSMFLHGGLLHLLGNLLYLWIFADNVEDRLGPGRFLAFYLLCGVAAALTQALPEPGSRIPMVGASGAISGVLGAYLLLYPRAQVSVLIPLGFFAHLTRLPAVLVLGLWFVLQLLSEMLGPDGAGVAFRAHIGGFLAGLILLPVFHPRIVRQWRR